VIDRHPHLDDRCADLTGVRRVMSEAIDPCRKRQGPAFVEAETTRWPGSRHIYPKLDTGLTDLAAAWEPQRVTGDHAQWISQSDPVLRYAKELAAAGHPDLARASAIDEAIGKRLDAARSFAVSSPYPRYFRSAFGRVCVSDGGKHGPKILRPDHRRNALRNPCV
jgi:TPP-dependent pyruvate/acetoin dehydrogenase alpha subunit